MARTHKKKPSRSPARRRETDLYASELGKLRYPMELICGACGQRGSYEVGSLLISPRIVESGRRSGREPNWVFERLADYIGFTRYFRCHCCDAGGPWKLTDGAILHMTALMFALDCGEDDCGLYIAENRTSDGQNVRYPTEAEAIIKDMLECTPDSSSLWVRLGNVYRHGERLDLAEPAYRRALELDPHDVEAHAMLAEVLHDLDRPRDALSHWKAVLQHMRHARQVPREQRMELVSTALDRGLSLVDDPNEVFGLMPTSDPAELAASREEPLVIEIREWDFGNPRDWDDICAVFVDGHVPRRGEVSDLKLTGGPQRAVAADNPLRLVSDCDTPRNDPCTCGSGRKYKKCCGRPAAAQSRASATVGSGAS